MKDLSITEIPLESQLPGKLTIRTCLIKTFQEHFFGLKIKKCFFSLKIIIPLLKLVKTAAISFGNYYQVNKIF